MQDRCSGLWRGLAEKLLEQNLRSRALFPTKADQDQHGPGAEPSFPGRQNGLSRRPGPGQTK